MKHHGMRHCRVLALVLPIALAALLLTFVHAAAAAQPGRSPTNAVPPPFPDYSSQPVTRSSGLPLGGGDRIRDREFARYITTYLGLTNCHSMKFVFGQCYGGGLIDELAAAGITCTVSAQSAARHDEPSWGSAAEDFYLRTLAQILAVSPTLPLEQAARLARERDPFGPYAASSANRLEHPQYHGSGPISSSVTMTGAASFHAVLFAGTPDGARHWGDLRRWYNLLTSTYGFTSGEISVLYGDGHWPTGNDADGDPFPPNPGIPITAATRANLTRTLQRIGALMNPNEQFFFLASDHGDRGTVPAGTAPPGGNGACNSDAGTCRFTMTLSMLPSDLEQVVEGTALDFSYILVGEGTTSGLQVCFNDWCAERLPVSPEPSQALLPIPPGVFTAENVLTFEAATEIPGRLSVGVGAGTEHSAAFVAGRVIDAVVWFGPRTTQRVSLRVFLPLLLRN